MSTGFLKSPTQELRVEPNEEKRPVLTVPLSCAIKEGDGASEREDGTSGVWAPRTRCQENQGALEQTYYKRSSMEEGWLIDRDDCWIWRFHQDSTSRNKAGVFIDRGRRMPSGPPLLKERRHLTDRAAEPCGCPCRPKGGNRLKNPHGGQQQMSEDHGSAATRYPTKNPSS